MFVLKQKTENVKPAVLFDKMEEEMKELKDAFLNDDRPNQFEEWFDMMQILLSIREEVLKPTEEEFNEALIIHNNKLMVERRYDPKYEGMIFNSIPNERA
ncbi:hypothetical protein D3C75_632730 [compost metagenome]